MIIGVLVLVLGVTIGFFIGKDIAQDAFAEITTTADKTADVPTDNEEKAAAEESTEASTQADETTQEDSTSETTTKAAEYTQVNEIVYATTDVNVRAGAGTYAAIMGGLRKGNSIKRTAIGDNGWSRVSYNGKTAYIFSKYLTKKSPDSGSIDMCGISNTDAKNLTDLLEYIFFYGMESYDYKVDNAFEKAFGIIHGAPYYNFSELVGDIYRIHYENDVIFPSGDGDDMTDPRGYWRQYRYVDAEFIDFILENMFNVKPDHNYILYMDEGWSDEDNTYAYYEDGYYYSDAGDGGDGCGPEVTVKTVEILSDGKYQITVYYRIVAGDENGEPVTFIDGGDLNIIAEMKNIDGNSVWSFYEIKQVK